MDLKPIVVEPEAIRQFAELLAASFPGATHLNETYLTWLYRKNPAGPVFGFNAFDGERLAAHYACVPAPVEIRGERYEALLSLNTAVHPDYQGRGLFTLLADATYDKAKQEGFACVFGVANANSTPGFIRKLGFQLVCPLEARIGVGSLDVDASISGRIEFRRAWNSKLIDWRSSNPANPIDISATDQRITHLSAATGKFLMRVFFDLPGEHGAKSAKGKKRFAIGLFIGLYPSGSVHYKSYIDIPKVLRPSPLNFIYKNLNTLADELDPAAICLGFQDFDAY